MYKLVIADDEQLERESLKRILETGFDGELLIETAANGREALEAVSRLRADVVLMDIEMPGMSGIEASRQIRTAVPDCRILFLTAYGEFSYARDAIEMGAADYLLKPCSDRDLYNAVNKALEQIKSQRVEKERHAISSRKIENLTQQLEEQLVMTVMGGYLRPQRVLDQMEELGIDFCNGAFAVLRSPDGVSAERLRGIVKGGGFPISLRLLMYEYDDRLYTFGVSTNAEKDCAHLLGKRLKELSTQMAGLSHRRLYSAVGGRFDLVEDAQQSFYQALTGMGRCTDEQPIYITTDTGKISEHSRANNMECIIAQSLLEDNCQEAVNTMDSLLESQRAQQLEFRVVLDRVGKRLQGIFNILQDETGVDYCKKCSIADFLARQKDVEALRLEVPELLRELCRDVRDTGSRGGRNVQVMQEIMDYIGANYRRDIFLQQVAREMNYSDTYFSRLFKQCFNKNFVTYLTEVRVDAAKELLHNPTVNIKDIGAQVGYQDSNYFTKVFRRATGQSPSEYRSAMLPPEPAQHSHKS